MCKALSEGGRRCPIHRNDVKAFIKTAVKRVNNKTSSAYLLNEDVIIDAITSLRKTSTATGNTSTSDYFGFFKDDMDLELNKQDPLDAKTFYALNSLVSYIKYDMVEELNNIQDEILKNVQTEEPLVVKERILEGYLNQGLPKNISNDELTEIINKDNSFNEYSALKKRMIYAQYKTEQELISRYSYSGQNNETFSREGLNGRIISAPDEKSIYCISDPMLVQDVDITLPSRSLIYQADSLEDYQETLEKVQYNMRVLDLEAPFISAAEAHKGIVGFRSSSMDNEDNQEISSGKPYRKCKYCGQFISESKANSHTCPPRIDEKFKTGFRNDKLAEQLLKNNKNTLEGKMPTFQELVLKSEDGFIVDLDDVDIYDPRVPSQSTIQHRFAEGKMKDFAKENNYDYEHYRALFHKKSHELIGLIPIKDFYLRPNDTPFKYEYAPTEDADMARIDPKRDISEIYMNFDNINIVDEDTFVLSDHGSVYLHGVPSYADLYSLTEANAGCALDIYSFDGKVVFYRDENNDLIYSLNSLKSKRCYCEGNYKSNTTSYCEHKYEAKKALDKFLQENKDKKIDNRSTDEKIREALKLKHGVQVNDTGVKYITLELDGNLQDDYKVNTTASITELIFSNDKLSKLDINNLSTADKESLIHAIQLTASAQKAYSPVISTTYKQNLGVLHENIGFVRFEHKQTFQNIDGSQSNVTGYIEKDIIESGFNQGYRDRELKCDCLDYIEKYYCKHIQISGLNIDLRYGRDIFSDSLDYDEVADSPIRNLAISVMNNKTEIDNGKISYDELIDKNINIIQTFNKMKEELEKYDETSRALNASIDNPELFLQKSAEYSDQLNDRLNQEKENTISYEDNSDIFFKSYQEGINEKRHKKPSFEYAYENVTNGICAPVEGAKKFGYEIEVVHNGNYSDKEKAIDDLISDFNAAGLSQQIELSGYHANKKDGYRAWSIERDSTVDVEIVSPQLYDSPECWKQLELATDIIKKHGFTIDERCGGHISVSTHTFVEKLNDEKSGIDYINSAKLIELKNSFDENYEIFKRLGQDVDKGKHRGSEWCKPNFMSFSEPVGGSENHLADSDNPNHKFRTYRESGINISAMANESVDSYYKDHSKPETMRAEYRIFDGSLDPNILQQRLKLAAALTQEAENSVRRNQGITHPKKHNLEKGTSEKEEVETFKNREKSLLDDRSRTTHNLETFKKDSQEVASFIDTIFTRESDKKDAAKLFALTKW